MVSCNGNADLLLAPHRKITSYVPQILEAMTILRFRYSETTCPTAMIPSLRELTGLSISEIRNRVAKHQPLLEIAAFRIDWEGNRQKLVQIARQIQDGSLPLTVIEETNGADTPVPLAMLLNLIQQFRQIELETQTDIALETGDIHDPRDFVPRDAYWTL